MTYFAAGQGAPELSFWRSYIYGFFLQLTPFIHMLKSLDRKMAKHRKMMETQKDDENTERQLKNAPFVHFLSEEQEKEEEASNSQTNQLEPIEGNKKLPDQSN